MLKIDMSPPEGPLTHSNLIPPTMESYVVANPLDKILKAFPRWTKEGVKEALKIDVWLETQFKVENSEGRVLSPEDQAVNDAVEAAGRNIIAVIGSVTQSSIYTDAEHQLSPNLATALGYLQFLLVDINDNLSERFIGNEYDDQHTVEGRFIRGMGLYRKLAAIVSPDDFRDNYQDADSNFALSEQLSTKLDGARITLSELCTHVCTKLSSAKNRHTGTALECFIAKLLESKLT